MIAVDSSFSDFLGDLASQSQIALDTEADSLHCYFEKLCLIQIGWPGKLQLLEPLAKLLLTEFFNALRGKRLIFHDADYDLRLLRRSGEFPDDNIFDTMIAARLCGEPQLGLAALVEKYFNVKLSKASRKANWAERPLSSQMVEYALNDVRYLPDLAEIFEEKLHELDRIEWFYQSRDRMIRATRDIKVRDEETLWRISGYVKLPLASWSVLRALWQWRDAEAREWDKPPFYVMSNHEMLEIAELAPQGKKWKFPKLSQGRAERFQEMLEQSLTIPEEEWPKVIPSVRIRATKQELDRFRKFKDVRDYKAREISLDASIIASKAALEAAARDITTPMLLPWQRELLGIS